MNRLNLLQNTIIFNSFFDLFFKPLLPENQSVPQIRKDKSQHLFFQDLSVFVIDADKFFEFCEICHHVAKTTVLLIFAVEKNILRVEHVPNLHQQFMEIFLLFAESDRHREKILEFADQIVKCHDDLHQHLTVLENSHFFPFLPLIFPKRNFRLIVTDRVDFAHQNFEIFCQNLFDFVAFDALVLHLLALFF